MYISRYLILSIISHYSFPPFFSLSIGLCFSVVSGTLTSELITFWNWGTPVSILKRILLTVDYLFKVNFQRSSSLDILIYYYTWMWKFLYKIHVLYIHRRYIMYMHSRYYIYLKYIFMCVYTYLFLTDQFPPWCVKDLFTVGLESMCCLCLWTVLQTCPRWNSHSIGTLGCILQIHWRALYCFSAKL